MGHFYISKSSGGNLTSQDFIRECIYFQMNQFYCHLKNCWKKMALRIEPNKECTDKFFWPIGTITAGILCDQRVS